jgi:hypothetical protein
MSKYQRNAYLLNAAAGTIDRPGFFGTHVKGFQMQTIRQKPALPNA